MPKHHQDEDDNLVTATSLMLSLAPPRCPPHGTAHRMLYALPGNDPTSAALTHHHHHHHHETNFHPHHIQALLKKIHLKDRHRLPHPHLSFAPESADNFSRTIGSTLPLWWQNKRRDDGTFRSISDNLVTCSIPSLAIVNPAAAKGFIDLTRSKINVPYGKHPSQVIHLYLPNSNKDVKGFMFFVHGGAWGSGMPWMYRLTALPFLASNMAVAIVGYRTYPDGSVQDQVDDLEAAAATLGTKFPHLVSRPNSISEEDWLGVSLMGHSSGAHIAMLMLVERIERKMASLLSTSSASASSSSQRFGDDLLIFDTFIGLSGVYSISHHFDYEAGRGVEEISPMKPACGYTRESFDYYSPALRLQKLMSARKHATHITPADEDGNTNNTNRQYVSADMAISGLIPPMLLVHGVEDDVVPFTSTSEAARIIRSCGVRTCLECYQPQTGHAEVIMHIMLGGRSRDHVLQFLKDDQRSQVGKNYLESKL